MDVAQRLQKEEPNGDEIMRAYKHKMSTFAEDEIDTLVCFFAHTFAGYYRYVPWHPNPMTIAPPGRDVHIGPNRPASYPYMGRTSVSGFSIATADLLRDESRRAKIVADLMEDWDIDVGEEES